MKWTYSLSNKMVASVALLGLCLLVLLSNFNDREHTSNIRNMIGTMYKDRLLVEDYILKMTIDVYQIKEVLEGSESNSTMADKSITKLVSDLHAVSKDYLKTTLTESENEKFTDLLNTINDLEARPSHSIQLRDVNTALVLLNELSDIQLAESKLIMDKVDIVNTSGKASAQFASAIIIIILLVLQAIVFTAKTLTTANQTSAFYLN